MPHQHPRRRTQQRHRPGPRLRPRILLEGIYRAQSHFIASGDARAAFDLLLNTLIDVTGSEYGFIGRVHHDDAGKPFLRTFAIRSTVENDATRALWERQVQEGLEFHDLDSLLGLPITTQQSAIVNAPQDDPRRKGLPPGHPPLDSFLGLPIRAGAHLLGVAGIANRPGGYTETVADFLSPFLATCANMIQAQDTDERRRVAERALGASESRMRLISDAVGVGLWDWNPQTDRASFDRSYAAMIGLTLDEIEPSGSYWASLLHPDDLEAVKRSLDRHVRGEADYEVEFRMRHKDGSWLPILALGRIVERDEQQRPTRMVGVHVNLAERKRAEDERLRLGTLLQQIVDALPQRVFWKDTSCRYLGANRAFRLDSGRDPVGLTDYDLPWKPEQADFFRTCDLRVMQTGIEEENIIEPITVDDGRVRWLSTSKVPLRDGDGNVFGVLGTYLDITPLKEGEAELARARDAAEAANRAKSEFLATMSHEIRTPLNGVLGYVDLALDTPLSGDQRELLETVKSSGVTLLQIINDILDFSKLEAGKFSLERIPYRLRDVAADVLELLSPRAQERGVELVLAWPPAQLDMMGDPNRVRQVLFNLVGNAIKFSEHAPVTVSVDREASGDVRIEVIDRGVGIPPERQACLFQKFTQADSSTTRRFGGTGLGLAISRGIVEAMGGRIGFTSRPGAGTTFWWTLPVSDVVRAFISTPAVDLSRLVLIVDGCETAARALADQLAPFGVRCDRAASPGQALEWLATPPAPVDLVLIASAVVDATPTFVHEVSWRHPAARVALLSSRRRRSDLERYRHAAFADLILKPVARAPQIDTILRLLALEHVARASEPPALERRAAVSLPARPVLRVLLAEDNIVNQKLARIMLEKANCRVDVAATGREAVEMTARARYDLVFMDCQMPEMDGFEATATIRARERNEALEQRRLPIVALTANALQGDRDRCLAVGMDAHVSKPFTRADLDRILERYAA